MAENFINGDGAYYDAQNETSPGSETTLISESLIEDICFCKMEVSCAEESLFTFYEDGYPIATRRTSKHSPNSTFSWSPSRKILSGSQIVVTVRSGSEIPPTACEAFLMGIQQSKEGCE